ncbi:hypothetical protein ACPV5N_26365, partial [Vibrio alfacsensis]
EPTSMLDVSIRIGVLNLMNRMKHEMGKSFMYITHDIATARYFAEDTIVFFDPIFTPLLEKLQSKLSTVNHFIALTDH